MGECRRKAAAPGRRRTRAGCARSCVSRSAMTDVLLASMPFGPLLSPSIGLSLLQPQVRSRGLSCRIEYFTLAFADRIGQALYSKITVEHRAMTRAFVGEWIFSSALYDWPPDAEQRYFDDVLMKP